MAEKVYCNQCQFYRICKKASPCDRTFDCGNIHEQCEAPQNIRQVHNTDKSDKYVSCPSIINRFNNCKWFINKDILSSNT